ncbi:hypothetical protein A1O3_00209 [Capronia epimyces CBS 606.96]|uniref:XRCC4 coiled-coil domain-containing protein n=1 Tax=Capronia epimyces CBS 606.96 TaxID=1182542 RepID=W9ZAV5_9EURO|nr:uncharacterized protein A1O3_00209 [Capronia epimyces CBS 606.96]EXJ91659.1 hypothetical protein A1O3_00209 [Capronia epimyces CBS 606.96]
MAASSWVIRLEANEGKGTTPILVKVSRKEGGHDLDLDLLATDGDAAYAGKVRQRYLKRLRAKNYDGSDDDWPAAISYILRSKAGHPINPTQARNIDVTCSVSGKIPTAILSIAFLHKVEDITQKLGTLELPQKLDTDDIDLFGWALQAIEKRGELDEAVQSLTGELGSRDKTLQALQKQIDDLVEAKTEHEAQLLSKFTVLLNEKKLKIRNMQRVMSTAKTDAKKLGELRSVAKDDEPINIGRQNKRHAEEAPKDDETEESEAFETMEVDTDSNVQRRIPRELDSPTSRDTTPSPSETDEDEDNELTAPDSASRPRKIAPNPKQGSNHKSPSPLPPRRELPFQKKTNRLQNDAAQTQTGKNVQSVTLTAEDDEETASEDDEL